MLNFLQRICGIATLTRQYVDLVADLGVKVLDTRKTAPGLRAGSRQIRRRFWGAAAAAGSICRPLCCSSGDQRGPRRNGRRRPRRTHRCRSGDRGGSGGSPACASALDHAGQHDG
ncbi:hypothetical protein ACFWY6_35030 [Streptomyces sp. NPDC059037]|uniref:hypothetical protein n=1 Tax=Streptomyces sp. NPDC059037 TaxID=3346710 RepID=UPI0036D0DC48